MWGAHLSTAVHSQLGESFVLFCFFSSYSFCSRYLYGICYKITIIMLVIISNVSPLVRPFSTAAPFSTLEKFCPLLLMLPTRLSCFSQHSHHPLLLSTKLFWTFSPFSSFSSTTAVHHIVPMFWVLNILIILIPFLLHLLRIVDTKNSLLALGPRKQNKILFSSAAH